MGWGGRWGSTRVAQLGSIGQEKEAEIWLLLHRRAGKPLEPGQWDFKASKSVRMLRPPCRDSKQAHRGSPATLLGST